MSKLWSLHGENWGKEGGQIILSSQQIQISAKNLGSLALPNHCPRCFWIKLKLGNKLPWQIFPGIFSSIDSYSKKITWTYYQKYNQLPPWFNKFGNFIRPISVPHHSKFRIINDETNVTLTGVPDDVFLCGDGSYFIIDYKTAKFTKNADKLLPLYKVQLNGYAYIFEKLGMGKVSGLILCYYEPCTEVGADRLDSLLLDQGFRMNFKAHLLEIGLDAEGVVVPLLMQARELGDRKIAPKGRDGCEDCMKMGEIFKHLGLGKIRQELYS